MKIQNLKVKIQNKLIIKNFSLEIRPGELHVLMGPNGSGKSTLARALVNRAFLGFQNPVAVPGVNYVTFLRLAYNRDSGKRVERAHSESDSGVASLPRMTLDPVAFYRYLKQKAKILEIPEDWLSRDLNENFSGGEKKRLEILQALVLQPKFAVLDEPDTGCDVDSLKLIARAIKILQEAGTGILLITHYSRLLKYLSPKFVHILKHGELVKSGGPELIKIIDEKGYGGF